MTTPRNYSTYERISETISYSATHEAKKFIVDKKVVYSQLFCFLMCSSSQVRLQNLKMPQPLLVQLLFWTFIALHCEGSRLIGYA
jgi:hypothetical protein